jgi:hypothetical protein
MLCARDYDGTRLKLERPSAARYPATWAMCVRRSGRLPLGLALLSSACMQNANADYPKGQCPKAVPSGPSATVQTLPHVEDPSIPNVIPALPPREDSPASLPAKDGEALDRLDYPPADLVPSVRYEPASTQSHATNHGLLMGPESHPSIPEVIAALPLVHLPTPVGHGLLAVDAQQHPYKILVPEEYVACGAKYVSQVRVCVNEGGTVSSVKILTSSIPVIDLQLPKVLALWKYRPYLVDGRPTAFCYAMNYRVH